MQDPPPALDVSGLNSLLPTQYLAARWGLPRASTALTRLLEGHTGGVNGVVFAPDGRRLASAGADHTVRLWDVASGRQTATLEGHSGQVRTVAFSPDGRRLASAGADHTLRLWDAGSGRQTATLEGHFLGVRAVAFSPDGRRLASAGADHTVRLWDAADTSVICQLRLGLAATTLDYGPTNAIAVAMHTTIARLDVRHLSSPDQRGSCA